MKTQFSTVTVQHNEARNGIEIGFPDKSPPEILDILKNQHFNWNHKRGVWYTRRNEEAVQVAHLIAQAARNLIQPRV